MLLTREPMVRLFLDSIEGDWDALLSGAVESARWLGKLHSSPVRIGPPCLSWRPASCSPWPAVWQR